MLLPQHHTTTLATAPSPVGEGSRHLDGATFGEGKWPAATVTGTRDSKPSMAIIGWVSWLLLTFLSLSFLTCEVGTATHQL